jgi:membrane protein
VIQSMVEGVHRPHVGFASTLVGLATLFFGGTAVVIELRDALNTIWRVPEDTASTHARNLFMLVKERLLSFGLVLAAGLFLLVSLAVNSWVSSAASYLNSVAPPPHAVVLTVNWLVSFALITMLFAFIFKVLPAVRLKWGDVGAGAVLTSLLFTAGKALLGVYLGKAGFEDSYGAAGSLVLLLVWVYYSAQVVYLGAEFTRTYTIRFGSMLDAKDHALAFAESYWRL